MLRCYGQRCDAFPLFSSLSLAVRIFASSHSARCGCCCAARCESRLLSQFYSTRKKQSKQPSQHPLSTRLTSFAAPSSTVPLCANGGPLEAQTAEQQSVAGCGPTRRSEMPPTAGSLWSAGFDGSIDLIGEASRSRHLRDRSACGANSHRDRPSATTLARITNHDATQQEADAAGWGERSNGENRVRAWRRRSADPPMLTQQAECTCSRSNAQRRTRGHELTAVVAE